MGIQGVAHIDLVPGEHQDLPVAHFRMELDRVEPPALHAGDYQWVIGQDQIIPGIADGAHGDLLRNSFLCKQDKARQYEKISVLPCSVT